MIMEACLKYYESLHELSLYNWDKWITSKNDNWFIVGYDNRQKVIESQELKELAAKLEDEYFTLLDDISLQKKLKTWAKIDNLTLRYNVVSALVHRFWLGFADFQQDTRGQFVILLQKYGYKIDLMNDLEQDQEDLILISNQLEGIKTQISILLNEVNVTNKKESSNLLKQLIIISMALGLNYRLNPKEVTVAEWIEYTKLIKERSKQN